MKFALGCILTLFIVFGGAYFFFRCGLLSFRADEVPGSLEKKFAMEALDASTERRASQLKNPVAPTELNLLSGMKLYKTSCAGCHGDPGGPQSPLANSFSPPAPQFLADPADMADNENFYIIKHGIRWTGMPAWGNILSDDDIWKITTFLSQMPKLPSAVDREWKNAGAQPPSEPN